MDLIKRLMKNKQFVIFSILALIVVLIAVFAPWIAAKNPYDAIMTDSLVPPGEKYMISFPGLVLAIAVAGLLEPNMINAILAIALVSWPKYARLARSLVLKIKNNMYIEAAVVGGARTGKIIGRYLIPNMIPTMIVTATTDIGSMMLELTSLSFLGFGAQAPTPEWGLMLNEGRTYITRASWLIMYPGMAIITVVIIFNMLGDSIRDILDPKDN